MKFCPNCGAKWNASNFCTECGKDLRNIRDDLIDKSLNTTVETSNNKNTSNRLDELLIIANNQTALMKDWTIKNGILLKYNGCDEHVVIPDGVTEICENAFDYFSKERLKSITFPENVKKIAHHAFYECKHLERVCIKDAEAIGDSAFAYCEKLSLVELKGNVCNIGKNVFSNCESLTSVMLDDRITTISEGMFSGCTLLSTFNFPRALKEIGEYAFSYTGFTKIKLPNSVTTLGNGAFYECKALREVSLGDNITSIGENTFTNTSEHIFGCLRLGKNIKRIQKAFFHQIKEIYVDSIETWLNLTGSHYWFNQDTKLYVNDILLQHVEIPYGVKTIRESAFLGCRHITSVTLPSTLQIIEKNAFSSTGVKSIVVPDSVTCIKERAFSSNEALVSISLPKNLSVIETDVLADCTNLKRIVIPEGTSKIEKNAFGCYGYKIEEMVIKSKHITENDLKGIGIEVPDIIYIPKGRRNFFENISYRTKVVEE